MVLKITFAVFHSLNSAHSPPTSGATSGCGLNGNRVWAVVIKVGEEAPRAQGRP